MSSIGYKITTKHLIRLFNALLVVRKYHALLLSITLIKIQGTKLNKAKNM